jgi:AcrR family transcriptional regulator
MTDKHPPKRSRKQRQLVETAETLFMRHGIKRVTVEEICRKASVSKMTFYKYFANKHALVKHLWNNWIEQGFDKLEEIDAMDIPFPEKIELMFSWKQKFLSKISTEFIGEFLHMDMGLEKIMERFLHFIVKAQRRGDIRPGIRPEFIMAVVDKLNELARDDGLMRNYPNHIEFRRELKDFFWSGILARPDQRSEL